MALIGEIQKRIWIVFIFIAIALVGFLIMDGTGPGGGNPFTGSSERQEFASVGGTEIQSIDYEVAKTRALQDYLVQQQAVMQYKAGQFEIDDATRHNLNERAWQQLVEDKLLDAQLAKAGISLSDDEFANLVFGDQPHPYMQAVQGNFQSLQIPPGPGSMQRYVDIISNQEFWKQSPQIEQLYLDFLMREKAAKRDAKQQKYANAMQKGVYTPDWLAARDHQYQNMSINMEYISLPYREVDESEVVVPEEAIIARYNNRKSELPKRDPSRNVEYVAFDVIPTPGDSQIIRDRVSEYLGMWKEESNDSTFLSLYSVDEFGYTPFWLSQKDLYSIMVDSAQARSLFGLETGAYSNMYQEGDFFKIAKKMDAARMTDSTEARHIFFRHDPENEAISQNRADSVYQVLMSGAATFEELAATNSDDESNRNTAGTLGWIVPNTPMFGNMKSFAMETGELNKPELMRTEAGWHIMEITERKRKVDYIKASWLAQEIRPSKETDDFVYLQAETFYENFAREAKFDEGVSENGFQKRISGLFTADRYEVSGLPGSRAMVEWAYNDETAQGDVNQFNLPDKYVVAKLKERNEAGAPSLEQVRTQMESEIMKEKRGDILLQRLEGKSGDLAAIAGELGATVRTASNVSFASTSISGLGAEPQVVGELFSLNEGETSKPIVGNNGVFIIKQISTTPAPENADLVNINNRLTNQVRNKYGITSILNALKDGEEIVDNRRMYN